MTEIKYLRPELLEAIARNTLKKYDSSLILGYEAKSVPIEDIIESLGLTLEYQYIRKNGRILGETVFDDDYIPIYNMEAKQYELIFVERGTIILDASLLRCRTQNDLLENIVQKEEMDFIKVAINTLSELQKSRIVRYFFQEKTLQEIADEDKTSLFPRSCQTVEIIFVGI